MMKIIVYKYECKSCGTILNIKRHIVTEEIERKIDLPKNIVCNCGEDKKSKFILIDLFLLEKDDENEP
jgi:hypothetical protein